MSYWSATKQGYEEWLLLDAGYTKRGATVAAWEVAGATLQQDGNAIVLADDSGVEWLRVTAPAAYAEGGRPVMAQLTARETTIELSIDADGEAVLVDPLWSPAASMSAKRGSHTATLLGNGKVLVAGGRNMFPTEVYYSSAELYDPIANTWSPAASMSTARADHTAMLLGNGKVLVAGGFNKPSGYLSSAELYNPSTNTWSPAGSMSTKRGRYTATLLGNNNVLVAGGYNSGTHVGSAELYNPTTNTWSPAGSMSAAKSGHTATLLSTDKVLVAGGTNGAGKLASAELYDPATNAWSQAASMSTVRTTHTATALGTGKVLVAGGHNGAVYLSSAELYDPTNNTWSPAASLIVARNGHTATLLGNGKVLVAGGFNFSGYLSSATLYNPGADAIVENYSMADVQGGVELTVVIRNQGNEQLEYMTNVFTHGLVEPNLECTYSLPWWPNGGPIPAGETRMFTRVAYGWTLASLKACGGYWKISANPNRTAPEVDFTNNDAIFPND